MALPRRRWWLAGAAPVAAWLLAVLTMRFLPDVINPGPPVSLAVGGAAFFGIPYRGSQLAAVVAMATVVAVSLAAAWRTRDRAASAIDESAGAPPSARAFALGSTARGRLLVWLGAGVLAFTLVPDLRSYLDHAGATPGRYSWDSSNDVTWQLLTQAGLVPMTDFFYPYGFQWLYFVDIGPVIQWLAEIAMLAIATWSLWRLSGGRILAGAGMPTGPGRNHGARRHLDLAAIHPGLPGRCQLRVCGGWFSAGPLAPG